MSKLIGKTYAAPAPATGAPAVYTCPHLEYVKGELCPHCGREYKTEKGLADHIAKEHSDAPVPGEE